MARVLQRSRPPSTPPAWAGDLDTNRTVAARLEEVASLLEDQHANAYRVGAYRRAAATVRGLDRSVAHLLDDEGVEGLVRLPTIGESIARSIAALVRTGRLPMLERMRGESDPEALLRTVPGIGERLADRLHHDLGITTLEELEAAAHDGRLHDLAGIGDKRLSGIRDALQTRLARLRVHRHAPTPTEEVPIDELLGVDREYRQRAAEGRLRTIAPRRFNPSGEAWLPVLHTRRGAREYTALFSNTARAHRLGTTRDWVVIYVDGGAERQHTVVTGRFGELGGRRIVRGRERECAAHYRDEPHPPSANEGG